MSSQILGSTESLPIDELETYHKNPRRERHRGAPYETPHNIR